MQFKAWTQKLLAICAVASTLAYASPAFAEGPTPGAGADGLNQIIDPNQAQGSGQVVLNEGHIDFGPTLNTGKWAVEIHDDTHQPRYWRLPSDVVIKVSDTAKMQVPDDPDYAFVGKPGSEVYVVPQTQKPGVIWAGWNTQEPTILDKVDLGVTMSLVSFSGPGQLSIYQQSGVFGKPEQLYNTSKGTVQSSWIALNNHTHANWVFTAPGIYLVEVEFSAKLKDGSAVVARDILRFAVGDATDTKAAFSAQLTDNQIKGGADNANADQADQAAQHSGVPMIIWIGLGLLAVALGCGVIVVSVANARTKAAIRQKAQTKAGQE